MSDDQEEFRFLTPMEQRLAASVAAAGDNTPHGILYQHTVLCQTGLPYRNPGDDVRSWERTQGRASLRMRAGEAFHPAMREWVEIGLPFGPKPRLVLAHLNSEALRTGSPTIEVEDSLTAFAKRLGLAAHGRDLRVIKDQLARLSAAEIRLAVAYDDRRTRQVNAHIVGEFDLWFPKNERQRVLWPTVIVLDERYFVSLQQHAVPLHPEALGALSHSAMGLDLYAWLAQRLHRIKPGQPQFVTWKAIKDQFGWHYNSLRKFRQVFKTTLRLVLTQYSGARIEADERGLSLYHSPPPVLCRRSPLVRGTQR